MSFIVKNVRNPISNIKNPIVKYFTATITIVVLALLTGFFIMFVALFLYSLVSYINNNIFGQSEFGITVLQYTILGFNLGSFIFFGPWGFIAWTLASLWNGVGGGITALINWGIQLLWSLFPLQHDAFGRPQYDIRGNPITALGVYVPLVWVDVDTNAWVQSFLDIATFLRDTLIPELPSDFFSDPNNQSFINSIKLKLALLRF